MIVNVSSNRMGSSYPKKSASRPKRHPIHQVPSSLQNSVVQSSNRSSLNEINHLDSGSIMRSSVQEPKSIGKRILVNIVDIFKKIRGNEESSGTSQNYFNFVLLF